MVQQRLLGVFAHPDDESFGSGGMLARYVACGVDVHVCTVTDGAAGSYDPAVLRDTGTATLAELRAQELRCAAETLHFTLHNLRYADSGMEGTADNKNPASLYQADLDAVAADIVKLLCDLRPQVVVTHDPTGGYFHPDHIKVNHAVTRALYWLQNPGSGPACADGWQPDRVYYGVLPRGQIKFLLFLMRLSGHDPRHFGTNHDIDLTQVGADNSQIHVRLDVAPYLEAKQAASACHASQGGGGGPRGMPRWLARRVQRYEYYQQVYPPGAQPHADFFPDLG